jgi:hypothetical protein
VVSTVEQYLEDKKLRVMLLRPRADLPQLMKDPQIPHKAAEGAYVRATTEHVPYDFEMNYKDHGKLFCSDASALGNVWYSKRHDAIPARLDEKARAFSAEKGYEPPYWELVARARVAKGEVKRSNETR